MAPSKPATSKTGVEGTKKKRGGEKGEFTLKRVKGKSLHFLATTSHLTHSYQLERKTLFSPVELNARQKSSWLEQTS